MENCPKCGTKLSKTTYGRSFCPNCGIWDEDLKSEINDKDIDYAG